MNAKIEKDKEKKKIKSSTIDEMMGGSEPNWNSDPKPLSFIRGINWYSNQKDYKDSKTYTIQYLKEQKYDKSVISKINSLDEDLFKNLGYICRMKARGCPLELNHIVWIEDRINELKEHSGLIPISNSPVISQIQKPNTIQDRIFTQSTDYINEIEGYVDLAIQKRKFEFKPYDYFISVAAKNVHAKQIINHYKPMLDDIQQAISGSDSDLVEAYSFYKKTELKKIHEFIKLIIDDATKIASNSKIVRKQKVKKPIPADKKVAKLIYKKEDVSFKAVSIKPTDILGCQQLWVFNTKNKKLGVYYAKDESGLSVKGSSLENFNDTTSIMKTVRKPDIVIPEISKGTKSSLKKVMTQINAVENKLTGRLNSDTLLLKVIK